MLNVAGFAREGAGEENVYGVKSEYEPGWDYYDQNEEMAEAISTSRDSDHKDVKPSLGNLSSGLDRMVIPNQWSYGHQEILRKGDKNTFYCEVCYVELNSLETMKSHTNGAKHQKKMLAIETEHKDKVRRGLIDPHEKMPGVKPIPNPPSAKVKVPIRLQERIRKSDDPVVGLRHIKEFLAESDPEMEPHYECGLCGNKGTSNSMFSHIMGGKHRQAFAEKVGHRGSISKEKLLKLARDFNENGSRMTELLETITSDTQYPAWPAGKAPWAVERGGSGVLPPEARASSSSSSSSTKSSSRLRTDLSSSGSKAKIGRLSSDFSPQTEDEVQEMKSVGRKMMEMALRSEHSGLSRDQQDMLLGNIKKILQREERRRNIYAHNNLV